MKSYIDLINQFWVLNRRERFTPSACALYFYLLDECNRNYWNNVIYCPTSVIYSLTGLNNAAIVRARNELSRRGLIRFTMGVRSSQSPAYTILSDVGLSDTMHDTSVDTKSDTNSDTIIKDKEKDIDNSISKLNKQVLSIDAIKATFIADNAWKEDLKSLLTIPGGHRIRDAELDTYIAQFFQYLASLGCKRRKLADCRKHCINWIRVNISKLQNTKNHDNYKQKSESKCGNLKVDIGTANDYEAPF